MNLLTTLCLSAVSLLKLAGTAEAMDRIAIRDGRFVETGTGNPFRPLGVNYYRLGPIAEGKEGHSALSPGTYDGEFTARMMENLSRVGFNTVRTFLSNHSGPSGIVTSPGAAEINPAYLSNLVHFLRAAQTHGIRVVLCWDTWPPDCQAWAETPLPDESSYGWAKDGAMDFKLNGFRLTPKTIRTKANAILALIEALRKCAPDLLPVVLAWELENEVHFNLDQEPFLSRPGDFAFGGSKFDLTTDQGAQALMDNAVRSWANACADAIHAADAKALVSASVFTFAAVGRQGPGTWSKDQNKDMRVPARPKGLLDTRLDFVDLHLYARKTESESVTQYLQRDLATVEMPSLASEARRLGKPILIGESGIGANFMRRGPDWQTIHHDTGVELLREFHLGLAAYPFAGVLHWHYGSPDSTAKDEYPALVLFPKYGEVIKTMPKGP